MKSLQSIPPARVVNWLSFEVRVVRVYKRSLKILEELLAHDDFISSEVIATRIGVSSRTIREDLKQLTVDLARENITLQTTPGMGYFLVKADREEAQNYYSARSTESRPIPIHPESRIAFILKQLLFSEFHIAINDLAETLFISRSTVEKDLLEVERWLQSQNLRLLREPASYIHVGGSEIALRYAMINTVLETEYREGVSYQEVLQEIFTENQIIRAKDIIRQALENQKLNLPDQAFKHLHIYLAITLHRVKTNHHIVEKGPNAQPHNLARELKALLISEAEIDFTDGELHALSQYLLQTHISDYRSFSTDEIDTVIEKDIFNFIKSSIIQIEEQYLQDFSEDPELIYGLGLYLKSLLNRRDHRIYTKNPSLTEIKEEYPTALEMAVSISEMIQRDYQMALTEDEIGDIALYFCASFERTLTRDTQKPIRAILINSTGVGGAQLLTVKLKRYFPGLSIEGVYPTHRLKDARLQEPDLFISTTPMEEKNIPVIHINNLLSEGDISRIHAFMVNASTLDDKAKKQRFVEMFSPELFLSRIETSERDEVIFLLSKLLFDQGHVSEDFAQAVIERESMFSTAIGNLVAIPHALPVHGSGSQIAVGILKKPIQWGEDRVQLVFLLNIQADDHFKAVFEVFFDIINSTNRINKLLKAITFEQFIQEIQ